MTHVFEFFDIGVGTVGAPVLILSLFMGTVACHVRSITEHTDSIIFPTLSRDMTNPLTFETLLQIEPVLDFASSVTNINPLFFNEEMPYIWGDFDAHSGVIISRVDINNLECSSMV